jgi:hypothetical protein
MSQAKQKHKEPSTEPGDSSPFGSGDSNPDDLLSMLQERVESLQREVAQRQLALDRMRTQLLSEREAVGELVATAFRYLRSARMHCRAWLEDAPLGTYTRADSGCALSMIDDGLMMIDAICLKISTIRADASQAGAGTIAPGQDDAEPLKHLH